MSRDEQDFDEPHYYDDDDKNALDVLHEAILNMRASPCKSCVYIERTMLTCNPPILVHSCKAGVDKDTMKETYEGKRKCDKYVERYDDIREVFR